MPDSLPPPSWGIPSYDERDLDALLSGKAAEIPAALRPLADTLAALKGPPTLAELRGEATIVAEFRALAEFGALGSVSASGPARGGGAHADRRPETLELPALQPDPRPRGTARHRVRRPANRRFGAYLVTAAAAAVVGTVAFTGNLPVPHLSAGTPRAASSTAVRPTSPNLQDRSASSEHALPHGERSVRPSPSPSPSVSASKLCRSFFSYFEDQADGQQWWNSPVYSQLSAEAGGSGHILAFCRPYLKGMFPHGVPAQFPSSPGASQSSQQVSGSDGNIVPGQNPATRAKAVISHA